MKDGKNKIMLGFVGSALALVGVVAYLSSTKSMEASGIIFTVPVIVMVGGATYILLTKNKNLKAGLPIEDELSKKQEWKAGAYAYYSSIWVAVGAMWLSYIVPLTVIHVVSLIVFIPGIVFMGATIYFNKKGGAE